MEKIVYLDFDGVCVNTKKRMSELKNLKYRTMSEPLAKWQDINMWDAGFSPKIVESIFDDKEFFNYNLKPFDGLYDALEMLRNRDYKIILYTKGTLLNISNKAKWVQENLEDYIDGHIFTGSKNVSMGKSDYDMSVEEGFSILIDDNAENLLINNRTKIRNMPDYSICAKLCGDDEEWNKEFICESRIMRKWSELERIITYIEELEGV